LGYIDLWLFIFPKIDTSKFDGNYPITWIFKMEKFFEITMKQLRNQALMDCLIKWISLPIEYSTSEDSFIQKHQQLFKHWDNASLKGRGMLSPKLGVLPPKLGALAPNCGTLH
jgi:hypothetical protein